MPKSRDATRFRQHIESGPALAKKNMKIAFFSFLVFLGSAIFLLSFVAHREMKAGDDRVARKMSRSVIDPKAVSERSPYMRTER
jgi:hypothetical protein